MSKSTHGACCPRCRLVQEPAELCRSCGNAQPRDFAKLHDSSYGWWWSWLSFLAVLPGTMVLFMGFLGLGVWIAPSVMKYVEEHDIFFIPFAGFALGYFVFIYLIDRRMKRRIKHQRQQLMPARRPPVEEPAGMRSRGTIAPLSETIPSHLGSERCVASSLELMDAHGQRIYLRIARNVEFLLKQADGELMVVVGEVLLHGASPTHQLAPEETPALLKQVLPALGWTVPVGAREHLLQEGDLVEIISEEPFTETVPALTRGYRDSAARVARGEQGRPIYIKPVATV